MKYHIPGGLNKIILCITFLEIGKSKIKVPARWFHSEACSLGL